VQLQVIDAKPATTAIIATAQHLLAWDLAAPGVQCRYGPYLVRKLGPQGWQGPKDGFAEANGRL